MVLQAQDEASASSSSLGGLTDSPSAVLPVEKEVLAAKMRFAIVKGRW